MDRPIGTLAVLSILLLERGYPQDCSTEYSTSLPRLEERSRTSVAETTSLISDNDINETCYNTGSYQMPVVAPYIGYCGTYYPIYMEGPVPTIEDGAVTKTVCKKGFFSTGCSESWNITMRICSDHIVYCFKKTPANSGYCLDPVELQTDDPIADAPEVTFPAFGITINTDFTGQTELTPQFSFACNFALPNTDNGIYTYLVRWYVDGKAILNLKSCTKDTRSDTDLLDEEFNNAGYTLGRTITCAVSASVGAGYKTVSTHSDGYYAGLIIHTQVVSLVRGETGTIIVQPTVPILCKSVTVVQIGCYIPFVMFDLNENYENCRSTVAVNDYSDCGTKVLGDDYIQWSEKENRWNANFSFTITTSNDDYRHINTYTLALKFYERENTPEIWRNYPETTVQVLVTNNDEWERKQCYSHIDPHMKTFDQQSYENQEHGYFEFILYEHEYYPMQVQVKHTICWRGAAECVCATTIRAGGDIFVVDLCKGRHIVRFFTCKENILDVKKIDNYRYHVFLPTGTRVEISIWVYDDGTFQNVDIYPSIKDYKNVKGLCGHFDGTWDDFRLRDQPGTPNYDITAFKYSWRIDADESFLSQTNQDPELWDKDFYLCACSAGVGVTSDGTESVEEVARCSPSEALTCKRRPNRNGDIVTCTIREIETTRRRRSTRNSMGLATSRKELTRLYKDKGKEDMEIMHRVFKRQANESSLSYEQAHVACEELFQNHSKVMAIANDLPVSNVNSTLDDCAKDLSLTGDMSLFWPHVTSLESNAQTELERDIEFTEQHGDIAYTVVNDTCLKACSGQGICENGACKCNEGFGSSDCSVDLSIPPGFTDVYAGGLCDLNDDVCTECISLYGTNILEGFVARVKEITHFRDGNISTATDVDCATEQISLFEGAVCVTSGCSMTYPKTNDNILVVGYEIAVSNDGEHFGAPLKYYEYDSRCHVYKNVSGDTTFTLKENSCFIDGMCFNDSERNPDDSCYKCSVEDDVGGWTSMKDTHGAADCSVDLSEGPAVTNTSVGDVCDSSSGECSECILVNGENFLTDRNLYARIEKKQRLVNGGVASETYVCMASVVSATESEICPGTCARQKRSIDQQVFATQYIIAFSYDSINFGSTISYYVLDSTCQEFDTSSNPILKNSTCFIEGNCYVGGSLNPTDSCKQCLPVTNLWTWTAISNNKCSDDDDDRKLNGSQSQTIIISTIASVVGLVALLIIAACVYKKCNKGRPTSPYNFSSTQPYYENTTFDGEKPKNNRPTTARSILFTSKLFRDTNK